uniref:DUF2597 family protein n=1 Tax=Endozoicomonas sp. SESOKO4 TaxID=2828745 RepID=UPI002147FF90
MTQRISGKNFDIEVGDFTIRVSSASLEISDNFAVALDKGIPNGWVDGDVTGEGEFQVDASN